HAQEEAKLLKVASQQLRHDHRRQATETVQRTKGETEELKRGVERAAESVLGDDTEALRMAQQELDQITEQLQKEMAAVESTNVLANPQAHQSDPSDRSNPSQASHKPSDSGQPGQQNASQPSANEQPTDGQQTQNGPGANPNSPASRTANLSAGGANAGGGGGDWGGAWLRHF